MEVESSLLKAIKGVDMKPIMGNEATPDAVLDEMPGNPWIHLSCHGVVLPHQPLESYFRLEKHPLCVKDIIGASLHEAGFAYLSACHSAAAGGDLPDENIHLAAALQFAGFASVVGTLWEMYDEEGPPIAKDFYSQLMELGGRHTDAAEALHHAIKQCRMRGAGPERWAMFIHLGA